LFGGYGNADLADTWEYQMRVGEVKRHRATASVTMPYKSVSAVFDACFYLEDADGISGIKVVPTVMPPGIAPNKVACVNGVVQSGSDGECYIAGSAKAGSWLPENVRPVGLSNTSLGGGDFFYEHGPPAFGQMGVFGGAGLNNIGLLVRTFGRVTANDATSFYIADGSNVSVKVVVPSEVSVPAADSYVAVTGVSSCEKPAAHILRLLRVSRSEDIQVLKAP